jgi:hypothetical protein
MPDQQKPEKIMVEFNYRVQQNDHGWQFVLEPRGEMEGRFQAQVTNMSYSQATLLLREKEMALALIADEIMRNVFLSTEAGHREIDQLSEQFMFVDEKKNVTLVTPQRMVAQSSPAAPRRA